MAAQFQANVVATERFVGSALDAGVHGRVVHGAREYLAGRHALFAARIDAGMICDGHGDLQAADIYCMEDGPRILDCLEFDDRLRFADVAADVAFLAMDLERLGAPSAALCFVRDYEEWSGAPLPRSLLHFYRALRAYVRTKVACLRYEQGDPGAAGEAMALLALALDHLEQCRVRLVLVGGLPGSGKSTLAAALGDVLGATVLRSDVLRHELSMSETHPGAAEFREDRYAPARTQEVYNRLLDGAQELLANGETVVLDASWTDANHRHQAQILSRECSAQLVELRCSAPTAVIERRVAARLDEGEDLSEATVEVTRAMAQVEHAWPAATAIDTAGDPQRALAAALRAIGIQVGSA